ncbi:MAG TPA: hypothetical protein VM890_08520 [Longimicrobium sp.]|jgi:hypothetical protein|nr:hypothetical protein [Longimicrobium sp.]
MIRLVSVDEFCENPEILAERDLALSAEGAPFAMVVGLHDEEDPAELSRLIRRARAEAALRRIRERAHAEGLDSLTMDEIDAEIATARTERKA